MLYNSPDILANTPCLFLFWHYLLLIVCPSSHARNLTPSSKRNDNSEGPFIVAFLPGLLHIHQSFSVIFYCPCLYMQKNDSKTRQRNFSKVKKSVSYGMES